MLFTFILKKKKKVKIYLNAIKRMEFSFSSCLSTKSGTSVGRLIGTKTALSIPFFAHLLAENRKGKLLMNFSNTVKGKTSLISSERL